MNIPMLIVVIFAGAYAATVWLDPKYARSLARFLNRRATSLEASREAYKRTMQWCKVRERE